MRSLGEGEDRTTYIALLLLIENTTNSGRVIFEMSHYVLFILERHGDVRRCVD